jgi:CRISPR/Cas system-associated exonuclease Cas4 (RecB family)
MMDRRAEGGDPYKLLKEKAKEYRVYIREDPENYGDLIQNAEVIFRNYETYYENDGLTYVTSEHEVRVQLIEGVEFVAHIDKIVEDGNNLLWVMEHKNHRNIPDTEHRMSDLQTVLYLWAYNQKNKKKPAIGIIWDYLRSKVPAVPEQLVKGGLSQRKNMDTTYETYVAELDRLKLDHAPYQQFLDYLKSQVNSFYERVYLPMDVILTEAILDDTRSTAREIKENGLSVADRNLNWQCKSCEFFDLCMAELRGLDSKFIRKSKYIEEEPNGSQEEDD